MKTIHMTLKKKFSALAAGALMMTFAATANANLITDGSFETSTVTVGQYLSLNGPDTTTVPGWSLTGNVYLMGTIWQASDGINSMMIGAAGSGVSQTFATVTGNSYTVTFDLSGDYLVGPALKTLQVSAGASSNNYSFDTTGISTINMGYLPQTFTFTATGANSTLDFLSTNANLWGPVIDNVNVVQNSSPASIPEPASLALLGVGLMGLAARRRRN